jgi:hypothetical protein
MSQFTNVINQLNGSGEVLVKNKKSEAGFNSIYSKQGLKTSCLFRIDVRMMTMDCPIGTWHSLVYGCKAGLSANPQIGFFFCEVMWVTQLAWDKRLCCMDVGNPQIKYIYRFTDNPPCIPSLVKRYIKQPV